MTFAPAAPTPAPAALRSRWLGGVPALAAALMFLAAAFFPASAQTAGRRVALVIGNGAYRNVERLANPGNDARLMASTLQAAGFTLVGGGAQLDLDKPKFDRLVQQFGKALPGAEVALFYYSGHGMQVQGSNWLVPVDANPTGPKDLDFQMIDASLVLHQMEDAGTKLNLVILDACRNNPFAFRGIRASGGGLAEMHAPEGTLISYATQPGNVAADGATANSPYTAALVDAIRRPGVDVFHIFNQVGLTVKQATAGAQQPWLASSPISGNFFFFTGPVSLTIQPPPAAPAPVAPAAPPAALAPGLGAATRFDGDWIATVDCEAARDGALGYHWTFSAQVARGAFHGVYGVPGTPSSFTLDGSIAADGSAKLFGVGRTGAVAYSVGRVGQGTPFSYHAEGTFTPAHGSARRIEVRACQLEFVRQ